MKQSFARIFLILSLILSLISFILTLIAFYLPNWKYIQLRSISLPLINSENNQMDPLIRSEFEKYNDILYRQGEIHSYGLFTHCIIGGNCGKNFLLSFDEKNYEFCHNIKYHYQCIFSNLFLSEKCTCEKPFYIYIIYILLILIIIFQILFLIINLYRLYCYYYCQLKLYLNDIYFKFCSIIIILIILLFLFIIIIQENINRFNEPLEVFQLMYYHYLNKQIYQFSNDLELIIKQIKNNLDINFGASYICIILIFILTIIIFIISLIIEIKILSISDDDEEKKKNDLNHINFSIERFVPSEQIRFTRQTKV